MRNEQVTCFTASEQKLSKMAGIHQPLAVDTLSKFMDNLY